MKETLLDAFENLRIRHRSHYRAAKSIGIDPDHYRKMRNGRVNIPQRTADYIILKAFELEVPPASPATPMESPSEARP